MTESHARRAAMEAALAEFMKSNRIATIGELGVAALLRTDAIAAVERAQAQAEEAVQAAVRQGHDLVEAARESAHQAALAYEAQYQAALDVGWNTDELERMGYLPDADITSEPPAAGAGTQADPVDSAGGRAPAERRSTVQRRPAVARRATTSPANATRRQPAPDGPPRVSLSGLPGLRPQWPPISPRRDGTYEPANPPDVPDTSDVPESPSP
ncbi:hypothetical protein FF36_05721 [Frankia torreyi]|uniref:Uncharacterized protein n=2 Tax=Frankia TaxID=1854 RepID=A0A0D8B7T8_9ACTN|nr:hypothetical protein [Frankia torreyi]KJE20004.1 hypothetical protein FF36_05721 [Frankia torreyi]